MKKHILFLTTVLAFACVLSICAQAESAQKRDSVNLSTLSALSSIDPHATINVQDQIVLFQVYDGLYHQNERTGKFEPRLAKSYKISKDGLTYTFDLRKDVKFHNGEPMKASDVVFSFKRAKSMPAIKSRVASIANVVAKDDYTVDIILSSPNSAIMTNLCIVRILSEKEVTKQGKQFGTKAALAGAGPYYFTYVNFEVESKLEAFPDYYRGKAPIRYVNYKPIADASAGLIAFESGEIDWYVAPIANWDQLANNPKYNTELVAANHITYVAINWLRPPLDNDNLRKAIAYAIDKESINLACYDGHAEIANFMEKPEYNVGAPSKGKSYSYDLEKAKEYMKLAGYPKGGVHVGTINCAAGGYYEKISQVLQANLAEIGVQCTIERLDGTTHLSNNRKQLFDLTATGYNGTGDYDNIRLRVHSASVGSYNVKYEGDKFDYKRMDKLIDMGVQEADPVKRQAIYTELSDMIWDSACLLPIYHKTQPYVWAKNLNAVNYPNYQVIYEWSWK